MNSWKVILATVVIFGAGVMTGGLLVNYVGQPHLQKNNRPPQPFADSHSQNNTNRIQQPRLRPPEMFGRDGREFMQKLDDALQLTPEQHDSIQKIIADGQKRNSEIWSNALPQMRQIMTETRQQIREQLTPEQQKRFEELMKRTPRRPQNSINAPPVLQQTNSRLTAPNNAAGFP